MNSLRRGLCPPWVARDLRARGEDAARFARLHRELIAWLRPENARTRVIVESLAEAWWEKLRRVRNWVGAGTPDTFEADRRIDDLLQRFVLGWSLPHRKWHHTLNSIFGRKLHGPVSLRWALEARLPSLGGKPAARKPIRGRMRRRLERGQVNRQLEAETENAARLAEMARSAGTKVSSVSNAARVAEVAARLIRATDGLAGDARQPKDISAEPDRMMAEVLAILTELGKELPKR